MIRKSEKRWLVGMEAFGVRDSFRMSRGFAEASHLSWLHQFSTSDQAVDRSRDEMLPLVNLFENAYV